MCILAQQTDRFLRTVVAVVESPLVRCEPSPESAVDASAPVEGSGEEQGDAPGDDDIERHPQL